MKSRASLTSLIQWCVGFLTLIAVAAVARRGFVLFLPPVGAPRFAGAVVDARFSRQRTLTLLHIAPSLAFVLLMPLQFIERIRRGFPAWHRWAGRFLVALGAVIGASALVMSFQDPIGGASEAAATSLYASLFLVFLALGFLAIRHRRVPQHREWMIRAYGVALGIATTRPIVALFFLLTRLPPERFFGAAFWMGFTSTLIATEEWIRYSRSEKLLATVPSERPV